MLAQSKGLGARTVSEIIRVMGEVKPLFSEPEQISGLEVSGLGPKRTSALIENLRKWNVERAREKLTGNRVGVISSIDDVYPSILSEIYDPPPALFYRGNPNILHNTSVAIVGTRSCTQQGKEIASEIGGGLARLGVSVVSGLAAGIDGSAHRGALDTDGPTVAVLGTGVDQVYPHRHKELQPKIADRGLLLSEYPPGTTPEQNHFPERNRIISGLSRAVVVVQAGSRSGALITADFALEQGREVYAVPGNISDAPHEGCHMLIKQGAGLVEGAEDILDYLQIDGLFKPPGRTVKIPEQWAEVFRFIKQQPIKMDEVVLKTELDTGTCSEILMELQNNDLIHRLPGQQFQRSHDARHYDVEVISESEQTSDSSVDEPPEIQEDS